MEEAERWLGLCETNQWASGADGPHQCARSERELMGQLRLRVLGSGRGRNACASSRSTGEGGQDMSTCMTTSARGVVPRRQPDSSRDRVRISLAALDPWAVPFSDGGEAAAWA